jgi:hypothetical protein
VKSALKMMSRFLYQVVFTSEDQLNLCLLEYIRVHIAYTMYFYIFLARKKNFKMMASA